MTKITDYFEDISQAFFFRNKVFGAALLCLFYFFDRYFFICGVLASSIAYVYTLRVSTPKVIKDSGLITINGFFFGIAIASLFKESPIVYGCLIVGAMSIPLVTKAVYEVLLHWKLSLFIVPYILSVWVICLCGTGASLELRRDIWPAVISTLPPLHPDWTLIQVMTDAVFQSMGRLLFLPNAIFGFAVFVLVTLFSPRRGLFFLLGTVLATGVAYLISSGNAWEYGLFSYSGGLVGLGLASLPEKMKLKTALFFCLISCFLTLAADTFLRELTLPVLSLPYVLTMWLAVLSRTPKVNMNWMRTQAQPVRPSGVLSKVREEQERVA